VTGQELWGREGREEGDRGDRGAYLSRCVDHQVAILVNQGSDATVPYQALVIRESAMLFSGFTPWGR
jgi:hypothetical protein